MPDVGPYDGRKTRRKRCDACVERKIRCRDGVPCKNCQRAGRTCTMTCNAAGLVPIFVDERSKVKAMHPQSKALALKHRMTYMPNTVDLNGEERNFSYFFTSYLPVNLLKGDMNSVSQELSSMAKISPALCDAIWAVAALHRRQQVQLSFGPTGTNSEALQAYGRSVRQIQFQIASSGALQQPATLWTTFLLGVFELMCDSTGTNWFSHFLHGTCAILRLQRPENLIGTATSNVQKRTFFLATRIFEIARSLIYSSRSFLSGPLWTDTLAAMWKSDGVPLWHPKEALFDTLPMVADLSIRAMEFCENYAQCSAHVQSERIQSLAEEGLCYQALLRQWWIEALSWEESGGSQVRYSKNSSRPDTEFLIACIYYHAISIYLSGTFDYHVHWGSPHAPSAPILLRGEICHHVREILRLSRELLVRGVSGVLLFFPLRVAGARATDAHSRCAIMSLLESVVNRGFVVAEAFKTDLSELWATEV